MGGAGTFLAGLVLAIGITLAGWLIASGAVEGELIDRHIEVEGVASQVVKANAARWVLSAEANANDLPTAQIALTEQITLITSYLTENGIDPAEIISGQPMVEDRQMMIAERGLRGIARFGLSQELVIGSENVDGVAAAARGYPVFALENAITSLGEPPRYGWSDAENLAQSLATAALADARERAATLAAELNQTLAEPASIGLDTMQVTSTGAALGEESANALFKEAEQTVTVRFQLAG